MKFKTYTGITWSLLELAGLLEDEDSHVHYEKIKKHLGLHPFHLTNLSEALNEILSSSLNSYDPELNGFLLAYKNPKLLTPLGDTFYDSYFIHVDIEADFYVFRPEVGNTLKGIVNKKGYNHIGILVHKAFNVSIPKQPLARDWPGDLVEIGQEVKFKITHLDLTSRLPFIRGSLNQENYLDGCKLLSATKKRKRMTLSESFCDTNKESEDSDNADVEIYQSLNQSKKLKKLEKQISSEKHSKKKKHSDGENIQEEETIKHSKKRLKVSQEFEIEHDESYNSSSDNVNSVNNTDTFIKKRKKSSKSLDNTQISEPEFDYSNVTIKVEKDLVSSPDTADTSEVELKKREKKAKKLSKKLELLDDVDSNIDNEEIKRNIKLENKNSSKKRKLSESDVNDASTPIKLEGTPKPNNSNKYQEENNHDSTSHRRKSSEKHIKKSVTDSESEFVNVQIKEEKNTSESEHTRTEDNRREKKLKVKKEKSPKESEHNRNDNEDENYVSISPKKHKKKREKDLQSEENFENITVKQEKDDNHSSKQTPPSNKLSKDKYINNADQNINNEQEIQHTSKVKKSPRKSKTKDLEAEPQEISIKVEKETIKSEHKIKREKSQKETSVAREDTKEEISLISPKKRAKIEPENRTEKVFNNYQLNNSIVEESEPEQKVFSPRKHSKKSKEPKYEILPSNVRIKIERSSSVES